MKVKIIKDSNGFDIPLLEDENDQYEWLKTIKVGNVVIDDLTQNPVIIEKIVVDNFGCKAIFLTNKTYLDGARHEWEISPYKYGPLYPFGHE